MMHSISEETFQRLTDGAEAFSVDELGPKVYRCADGRFLKLFRRRRTLSSGLLVPHAVRFQRNARRLTERGFRTVDVVDALRVPHLGVDAVTYRGIEGTPLRTAAARRTESARLERLLEQTAALFARLHEEGVYFRGAHFGNIIVCPDHVLGLVDVGDARFRASPLRPSFRARNLRVPLRYEEDLESIRRFGVDRFIARYLADASLDQRGRMQFLSALEKQHEVFDGVASDLEAHQAVSLP